MNLGLIRIIFIVSILFGSFMSLRAEAVFMPGMERAQYQATLNIVDATGVFADIRQYEITYFTVDGKGLTGFSIRTDDFRYLGKLIVDYSEDLGCGSKRSYAFEQSPEKENVFSIVVIDHTQRTCDDGKSGIEAVVYNKTNFLVDGKGSSLHGVGQAKIIYTIL